MTSGDGTGSCRGRSGDPRARRWVLARVLALSTLALPATAGDATPAPAGARAAAGGPTSTADATLLGFRPERVAAQRALEQRALALTDGQRMFGELLELTDRPRLAGTHAEREEFFRLAHELQEQGLRIDPSAYQVWLPLPLEARIERTAPSSAGPFPGPEGDGPTPEDVVMPCSGYAADGDVEAPLVYANRGLPDDYALLEALGVPVEGRIVLARYGGSYRGVKVREAERRGAAGVVLFSDPADDGFAKGPVHPDGPWRPAGAVQRGSVVYGFLYPGDPLTPGTPALRDAERIDPSDSPILPRIPCLPLAWRDAAPLLSALGGPAAPPAWQGAIPDLVYRIGRGDDSARAHLVTRSAARTREIANVIAVLPGGRFPEQRVLLGAHRDSWVYGAADNGGGTATIVELGHVLGALASEGWRPDRTLVLGLWDAEEWNLIGSTEYVEEHVDALRAGAVAYVNIDSPVTGDDFGASCSPSLRELVLEVARDLPALSGDGSLLDDWTARNGGPPVPGGLGSGSDFGPFLQYAGVACADFGFGGALGPYHALQDDMAYVHTVDPDMSRHARSAQVALLLALRLAQADLPPLTQSSTAGFVRDALTALGAAHPGRVPDEFAAAVDALVSAAARADAAMAALLASDATPSDETLHTLGLRLAGAERRGLDDAGLPGRPWFRHLLVSTSPVDGYGTLALPGLALALDGVDGDPKTEGLRLYARLLEMAAACSDDARAATAATDGDDAR